MNFKTIDKAALADAELVAESNQFAVYARDDQQYLLVQRHDAEPWTAWEISGDGLFRCAELLTAGTRHAYRQVAGRLTPRALTSTPA